MKKYLLVFAAITLLFTACQKDDDVTIPGEVTLKMGQTVQFRPNAPALTFLSITEDSRCPMNAACIWRGRAVAAFRAISEGKELDFSLSDYDNTYLYPRQSTWFFGHRIELLEVTPWPDSAAIPQGDYRVKVRVD